MTESRRELIGQVELFSLSGQFGCIKDQREFIFCVDGNRKLSVLIQPAKDRVHYCVIRSHACKNEVDDSYDVKFVIGIWRGILRPRMVCNGRLTASGMTGTFRYVMRQWDSYEAGANDNAETEEELPFLLLASPNSSPEKRLANSFVPMVPGCYELRGPDQTNWLVGLETDVSVELHSESILTGEVVQYHPQRTAFAIEGTWMPDAIRFTTKHGYESPIAFVGIPSANGLRGLWRRREGCRPLTLDKESAVLDLKLIRSSGRLWCKRLHPYTPEEFRQSVRWLLLSSLRANAEPAKVAIPSDLWCHVFSFMNEDWFAKPKGMVRGDSASEDIFKG